MLARSLFCCGAVSEAQELLGPRLREVGAMVDTQAGQHKVCRVGVAPTLTCSRAKAFAWYLPWRRQRVSAVEFARLQGCEGQRLPGQHAKNEGTRKRAYGSFQFQTKSFQKHVGTCPQHV